MEKLFFINKPLIDCIYDEVNNTYYNKKRPGVKLKHNLINIIEGIMYICKTGIQISFCEYLNIKGSVLKYHFDKWTTDNIFYKCWLKTYNVYQKRISYKRNLSKLSLDCTFIKSINGVDCIGKNPTDRGRNGSKISIISDLLGTPVGYFIDAANISDHKIMKQTIDKKIYNKKTKSKMYVDKGYSNKLCVDIANDNNLQLMAENKANAKTKLFPKNLQINKYRYVIEALNSWIKSYKKLILRYDRKIKNYESYLLLAFSMITTNKMKENGHLFDYLSKV